ncbi:CDP-diacylglycerol--glycerol-3-phosphate 3-phosphatidyltransferase [Gardnerella vaginalis]|uniref:CDP-diacylglycerol--glycerol-3-phosphate 3-phosphatidyltransferase n=1 Tax=Gardnerella vaginalis TaxID=2702 RepID=UPI0039EE2B87|nr:CDP-diacylglycerol--glycerol-3-phosphate 3-phosphatidyltransferase [Bifidobacterium sp. UMB1197]
MLQKGKSKLLEGWNCAPNIVTYVRIALSVVFIVLYLISGPWGYASTSVRWSAFVLFIVAASTDKLDGWMARKYNQVTELGKLLDPIADKLLILSALIIASAFGELYWWITLLFVLREIGITVLRFYVIDKGGKVIAASWAGKYKTLSQSVGIAMLLAPIVPIFCVYNVPMWVVCYYAVCYGFIGIALGFALYSGFLYVRGAFKR